MASKESPGQTVSAPIDLILGKESVLNIKIENAGPTNISFYRFENPLFFLAKKYLSRGITSPVNPVLLESKEHIQWEYLVEFEFYSLIRRKIILGKIVMNHL